MKHNQQLKYSTLLIIIFIITGLLLTACGGEQDKTYTIGVVNNTPIMDPTIDGFKAGMTDLGYVEGENVTYIYNGIVGPDPEAIENEIKNLLAQDVDILFTPGTSLIQTAKQAVIGTDTPIVFAVGYDVVKQGLVESLSQPDGNVTGVQSSQTLSKALEGLVKIAPATKKVFVPYNPDDTTSVQVLADLEKVSAQLGIELVLGEARSVEEAVVAIENLPADVQAIFRIPSPTLDPKSNQLSQAAIKHGLPTGSIVVLDEAVLLTLSVNFFDTGKQAARLAHQILQGVKPADLPIETSDFYLTINLKTANAIGLDIPDEILRQADNIIR